MLLAVAYSTSTSWWPNDGSCGSCTDPAGSAVTVRTAMSLMRNGSNSSQAASGSGSSSSSLVDMRLAKTRAANGDEAGSLGTVRRRRMPSEDIDNPWDTGTNNTAEPSSHPLAGPSGSSYASGSHSRRGSDSVADASRPVLSRLTSETEREVEAAGIASRSSTDGGSLRGSFDLLRTALKPAGEVEVLVHQVKLGESLQGIALQYGIDLPVLRKVNKLWASDPISLRRELYVPLDACRWSTTSQTVVRGPEEGQITLVTRKPAKADVKGKGKQREDTYGALDVERVNAGSQTPEELSVEGIPPDAEIPLSLRSLLADGLHVARVHNVLRVPASDFAFFPKTTAKDKPGRQSLDTYFASDTRPVIPRSPSSTDTLSAAVHSTSLGRNKNFVTVGSFRKPFSPPTMTPTGRGAIPNVRTPGGRIIRSTSNPSTTNGSIKLGHLSNGITSKLSSLFVGPESPSDTSRTSTDSTPRSAGAHEAPYELAVRTPSGMRPEAPGVDWFGGAADGTTNGLPRTGPQASAASRVTTTQPLRAAAMNVPGKALDRNHIDIGK